MAQDEERSPESRGFGAGYAIVSAGFQLALAILLFLWIGRLVDGWLHTGPVFMLVGLLVGLGAGMYAFLRRVLAEGGGSSRPKSGPAS
ncbi:MAG: AtpZ/AtpI family protein [Gemmatimonadales bacterium]|nr:AtpZ/AtpI family protein [Gemmatimonadales bacterium]